MKRLIIRNLSNTSIAGVEKAKLRLGRRKTGSRRSRYGKSGGRLGTLLARLFDNPVGRPLRKVVLTIAGVFITILGFALIVLPGPAFLLIPVGLAILSLEYPSARKLLRKFQGWMTSAAKKADNFFARRKARS